MEENKSNSVLPVYYVSVYDCVPIDITNNDIKVIGKFHDLAAAFLFIQYLKDNPQPGTEASANIDLNYLNPGGEETAGGLPKYALIEREEPHEGWCFATTDRKIRWRNGTPWAIDDKKCYYFIGKLGRPDYVQNHIYQYGDQSHLYHNTDIVKDSYFYNVWLWKGPWSNHGKTYDWRKDSAFMGTFTDLYSLQQKLSKGGVRPERRHKNRRYRYAIVEQYNNSSYDEVPLNQLWFEDRTYYCGEDCEPQCFLFEPIARPSWVAAYFGNHKSYYDR